MKLRWKSILEKICMCAVVIASVAQTSCRGHFYEPEEPEGLDLFLQKKGQL